MSIPTISPRRSDEVGALELVGGYKGVSGCIGGVKQKSIPISKLGYECGVGEGTLG